MNEAGANAAAPGPAEKIPAHAGWKPARWVAIIAFIFATHAALIFLFGEKKPPVPRAVTNVPTLMFASHSDELLALNDPTLFAQPNQRDFAAAWLKMPAVKQPSFQWTEPPQPLPLSADGLGAALGQFLQTNLITRPPFDFRPAAALSVPVPPVLPSPPQNSTMRIEGELAQRQLPDDLSLTNWPYADVLAPSIVQVLVDADGNLVSAVLLKSSGYARADDQALADATGLRFKPGGQLTFGRIIFNWHTVPPPPDEQDQ